MGLMFPVLGAAILTVHPGHNIGRVLVAFGALRALSVVALAWSYHGLVADPGSLPGPAGAGVIAAVALLASLASLPLFLVLLPDGRVSVPFQWIPKAVILLIGIALAIGIVFWPARGAAVLTSNGPPSAANNMADHLAGVLTLGQLSLSTLALVALLGKVREPGETRQQLEWIAFGAVMAVVGNLLFSVLPLASIIGFFCLAASIGLAVFRYRLWDIDRLIKGTIVYGALSAALIAMLTGTGVIAGSLVSSDRASLVGALLATVVGVEVLRPVHRWLQDRLDKVFDRGSWEATQRIRRFTAELGGDPPPPGALQALLRQVLDDDQLSLRYRLADGDLVDPWGEPAISRGDDQRPVEVAAIGSASSEIAHRPMTPRDGNRLARVLAESQVALAHGRMQAELQRQLVEIRRSRARLVTASDTERRRIERDLHDGVQAQLVSLGLTLRSAQRHARPELDRNADALIDQAVAGVQDAIAELRRFAQGIISPLLASNGLGGAVADLATRIPTPVTTDIVVAQRPAAPIESTAWYVTCEGITNALKHAPGAEIKVSIHGDGQQLCIEVSDRGPGGADPRLGTGLAGLFDRVEAMGGTLRVLSPAGAGTVLRAVLPCAS
jgi:signal transduction histidine kinase